MSLKLLFISSATAVLTDLIVGLAKKSPPYFIAPYIRLWKESSLLHNTLHNERFSNWKPQAARYVALRAIKARGGSQESPQPVLDLLESLLKRREPVVLLGEPGAGKTTAMEALTYRLAHRSLSNNRWISFILLIVTAVLAFKTPILTFFWLASYVFWEPLVRRFTVPLFIEARSDYFGGDTNEWCETIFKERLGSKPLIGSRHRVALFIDGVNEVQASLFGRFVEGWRARLRDEHACRVIFTSRGGEETPAQRINVEHILSVCDLDDEGVREFLNVYGRKKASDEKRRYISDQAMRDFAELQKKNLLGEGSIGRNPYWLKMIVESGLYTVNRGALFRNFADKLIRRETDEKPEERKRKPEWRIVPVEVEIDALSALALAMHKEKRIGFTDEQGWQSAREAIRESIGDLPFSPDDVLGEAQSSTLVRVQVKRRVEFVHQLVQEFFAAYALHPDSRQGEVLPRCEDVWWWQTLFLLGGLVGSVNPAGAYGNLVRSVLGDGSNEQRVFAAVGLLRSLENPPVEVSETVIKALAALMEKNLAQSGGTTKLNLTETQQRSIEELTGTLGEESAEVFAMLLEDPKLPVQVIGVLILSIVGNRRAAELIIARLGSSIYDLTGITPLVSIGRPAVEPLIAALGDADSSVHLRAAEALVRIGVPAVEPLVAALGSEDAYMRWRAASVVEKIAAPAVESLIAALGSENPCVRRIACNTLGRIRDARAVEPLIAAFEDEDEYVCWLASQALEKIGASSVEPLIAALRDEDGYVRERAATALGLIGDLRAVGPLIAALQDKGVCFLAANALGEIGAPAVAQLVATFREDRSVRWLAAIALEKIGAPAVEPLIAALKDKSPSSLTDRIWMTMVDHTILDVRESAATVLGLIRDVRAIDPLIAALRDKKLEVRWRAANALQSIGAPAVQALVDSLRAIDMDLRRGAANALGLIRDSRAVEPLIASLRDEDLYVRSVAAEALGSIGDARAVEPLITAFRDEDVYMRRNAAHALGLIGDARAAEPLIAALRDKDIYLRRRAARALEKIGVPVVEFLIALLRDEDKTVAWLAAETLLGIGDPRALNELDHVAREAEEELRPSYVGNAARKAAKGIRRQQLGRTE